MKPAKIVNEIARLRADRRRYQAALRIMRRCPGIDDTDQVTGDTFEAIIEAALKAKRTRQ